MTAPSSRPLQGAWAVTPSLLGAHGNPSAGAEAGKLGRHVLQDTSDSLGNMHRYSEA